MNTAKISHILGAKMPQIEDGYTRIANELLEAMMAAKFTARQWKVILSIVRKTYGYNKREDDLSASQIGALCEMHRVHATETLNQLARMNVISKRIGVHGCIVSIQKNYALWIDDPADKSAEKRKVNKVSGNHYTYRVTHSLTGEFYTGVRSCKCHPNQDRYIGSGNWVATVAKSMLTKVILATFDSREAAENEEIRLIQASASDPLQRNTAVYATSNRTEVVTLSTESVQGVQNSDFASTDSVSIPSTESVHTKDNPTKDNQKTFRNAIALPSYLETCKSKGVKPIPENDPVFKYSEEAGISQEFLRLHWMEFKDRHCESGSKRYKSWPQAFRNSVRGNWYRIWYAKDGGYALSTTGQQAKNAHEGRP